MMSTKNHMPLRNFFLETETFLRVFGVVGGVAGFEPLEEVEGFRFVGLPLVGEDSVSFELQESFLFHRRHIRRETERVAAA